MAEDLAAGKTAGGRPTVRVAGLSVIGPFGVGLPAFDAHWRAGRPSCARPVESVREPWLPVSSVCEVPGWRPATHLPDRKAIKLMSRPVQIGVAAALQAWGATDDGVPPERRAIYVGAGQNFDEEWTFREPIAQSVVEDPEPRFDLRRFATDGQAVLNPLWLVKGLSNNVLALAALYLDIQGPTDNFGAGAAGTLMAVAQAAQAILDGETDRALAGGADTLVTVEDMLQLDRAGHFARTDAPPLGQGAAFLRLEPGAAGGWGPLGWATALVPSLGPPSAEELDDSVLAASALAWARARDGASGPCRPTLQGSSGSPSALLRGPGLPAQGIDLWSSWGESGAGSGALLLAAAWALAHIDGVVGPIEVQAVGAAGEIAVVIFGRLR